MRSPPNGRHSMLQAAAPNAWTAVNPSTPATTSAPSADAIRATVSPPFRPTTTSPKAPIPRAQRAATNAPGRWRAARKALTTPGIPRTDKRQNLGRVVPPLDDLQLWAARSQPAGQNEIVVGFEVRVLAQGDQAELHIGTAVHEIEHCGGDAGSELVVDGREAQADDGTLLVDPRRTKKVPAGPGRGCRHVLRQVARHETGNPPLTQQPCRGEVADRDPLRRPQQTSNEQPVAAGHAAFHTNAD